MKKPIFLLLLLCLNALALCAQSDALDREIATIVSDLATKMATKTAIKNVAIADFTKLDGSPTELGKYLAEQFWDVMVNANTTFSIVDRGRLNYLLKALLQKGVLQIFVLWNQLVESSKLSTSLPRKFAMHPSHKLKI